MVDFIASSGGEVSFQIKDVTSWSDVENLVKHAVNRYGKLDVVIHNAGIMPISRPDDLCVEDWEKMIDVSIKGVLYEIAAALPVFRNQGTGHFINTASTAGHKADQFIPARSTQCEPFPRVCARGW